jgi:hypothetical protein
VSAFAYLLAGLIVDETIAPAHIHDNQEVKELLNGAQGPALAIRATGNPAYGKRIDLVDSISIGQASENSFFNLVSEETIQH